MGQATLNVCLFRPFVRLVMFWLTAHCFKSWPSPVMNNEIFPNFIHNGSIKHKEDLDI